MKWPLIGFGALLAIAPFATEDLTMDEAVAIALDNAFSVDIAESQAEQADFNARAASGQLGPQVSVNGNYSYFGDSGSAGFGGSTGGATTGGTTGGFTGGSLDDLLQVQFTVSQLIDISGNVRSGIRALEHAAKAAQANEDSVRNAVKGQVRNRFLAVLQASEQVDVRMQEIEDATARLKNAHILLSEGSIPEFDVLRLQTELRRAEQAKIEAVNALELAVQALNNSMGRPVETPVDAQPVAGVPDPPMSEENIVALAWETRPELRSLALQLESAVSSARAESGGTKPSLVLSANHSRILNASAGIPDNSSTASAVLQWSLFDSGSTKARVEAANRAAEQTRLRIEETKLSISLQVRQSMTNLRNAAESLTTALQTRELAQESLRLAQLRFDEGEGILIDVIASQTELTRARAAVVTARYQYLTAYAALQQAVGRDDFETTDDEGNTNEIN